MIASIATGNNLNINFVGKINQDLLPLPQCQKLSFTEFQSPFHQAAHNESRYSLVLYSIYPTHNSTLFSQFIF